VHPGFHTCCLKSQNKKLWRKKFPRPIQAKKTNQNTNEIKTHSKTSA
jgi:hypothetical protein